MLIDGGALTFFFPPCGAPVFSILSYSSRFAWHIVRFAIVCKHLRVVIGRQEGVAQSEVAREITYGESRFLLVRLYGMCIRVLWAAYGPVDAHLALGFCSITPEFL